MNQRLGERPDGDGHAMADQKKTRSGWRPRLAATALAVALAVVYETRRKWWLRLPTVVRVGILMLAYPFGALFAVGSYLGAHSELTGFATPPGGPRTYYLASLGLALVASLAAPVWLHRVLFHSRWSIPVGLVLLIPSWRLAWNVYL